MHCCLCSGGHTFKKPFVRMEYVSLLAVIRASSGGWGSFPGIIGLPYRVFFSSVLHSQSCSVLVPTSGYAPRLTLAMQKVQLCRGLSQGLCLWKSLPEASDVGLAFNPGWTQIYHVFKVISEVRASLLFIKEKRNNSRNSQVM